MVLFGYYADLHRQPGGGGQALVTRPENGGGECPGLQGAKLVNVTEFHTYVWSYLIIHNNICSMY